MKKELPILMCGEMVRAILDGRKTQTRRVVNPQPSFTAASGDSFEWHGGTALVKAGYGAPYVHSNWEAVAQAMLKTSPYVVGQRLWVKETHQIVDHMQTTRVIYRADGLYQDESWRPSIFMRRMDSRITLEITDVRVEWLQEITEDDAKAEGVNPHPPSVVDDRVYRRPFNVLWDSINGKGSWDLNPCVRAVSFKRVTK